MEATQRGIIDKKIADGGIPDREDINSLGQENVILCNVLRLCWRNRCDCTWDETMMLAVYHLIKQNESLQKDCLKLRNLSIAPFILPIVDIER